jgi:hypothetical protein
MLLLKRSGADPMRRKLSFRGRASLIAEPGRGVALASVGLMLLIMFFDALGTLGSLP